MDQSALNLAHQYGRKAIYCYRKRRFDEAAELHKKAADMLDIALARIGNPRSLESLGTQRRFHATQMLIALSRKEQFEHLKKAMEIEKNAAILLGKIGEKQEGDLKIKLFNMLSTAESLINELASRKNFSDSDKSDSENNAIHALEELHRAPSPSDVKDSLTIIKQLQDIIINVHSLVIDIADQLDKSNNQRELLTNEIDRLKSKHGTTAKIAPVSSLQKDTAQPSQVTETNKNVVPNVVEVTEPISRPETNVPNVESRNVDQYEHPRNISQLADFTELEIPERPPLPPLPPLEMPDIDYSMFISSTSLVPIPKGLLRNLNSGKNTAHTAQGSETMESGASTSSERQNVEDRNEGESGAGGSSESNKRKDDDNNRS